MNENHAALQRFKHIAIGMSGALGGLFIWWAIVHFFNTPAYVVPSPESVFSTLIEERSTLIKNLWPTAYESILGFMVGNLIAILLATLFIQSKAIERSLFPVAIFIQTLPLVAVAPILVLMIGQGPASKVVIAALIVLFPTLVNMVRGLQSVTPQQLELFKVMSASRWETFWKARSFASLPFLFTSLKIAATTAVVGAIVGEWVGANEGLGFLIINATYNFQTDLLYATMIVASLFALTLFGVTSLAERLLVRWDAEQ